MPYIYVSDEWVGGQLLMARLYLATASINVNHEYFTYSQSRPKDASGKCEFPLHICRERGAGRDPRFLGAATYSTVPCILNGI